MAEAGPAKKGSARHLGRDYYLSKDSIQLIVWTFHCTASDRARLVDIMKLKLFLESIFQQSRINA